MHDIMSQVVECVDGITSVHDVEQLAALEKSVECYFASPEASQHLQVWFRLFERFPEDDAYGIFWAILHGIERHEGYEPLVVESVGRQPSRFAVSMINRILNAGQTHVDGANLLSLLES